MNGISVWGGLLCIAIVYFAVYGVLERLYALCDWYLKATGVESEQD